MPYNLTMCDPTKHPIPEWLPARIPILPNRAKGEAAGYYQHILRNSRHSTAPLSSECPFRPKDSTAHGKNRDLEYQLGAAAH